MSISSHRLQKVWAYLLDVNEKTSNKDRDASGFMDIKLLDAVKLYLTIEDKLSPSSAKNQAYQIIKYLKDKNLIEVVYYGSRGRTIVGFKIIKLDPKIELQKDELPKEKKVSLKEERIKSPALIKEDLIQTLRQAIKEELAAYKKSSEQLQLVTADIQSETKKRPDILVLIDTANFNKGCQAMNVLMPIGALFSHLVRIGNVIATFAFYNQSCPIGILRLFVNHDCFLINCIDNKKGNSNEAIEKGDWIDPWIERFSRTFTSSLNFDVCVIVSGDHHFDPIQAKMRQYGKKVIRCIADENKKIVYLVGDCDTVTLKVQQRSSMRFSR